MAYISFQPTDFFNTLLYTGNGSTQSLPGMGFQPDFTWIKTRSNSSNHQIHNSVAAYSYYYTRPNTSAAQITSNSTTVTAFDSDGFSLGNDGVINESGYTYASWNWKGGTTSGIATNGSTTITPSTYSFSADAGISILKYTGNDTAGAKVAHGLGAVPKAIIVKSAGSSYSWTVYLVSNGATKYMILDSTESVNTNTNRWNDTEPDSVNFTLGSTGATNGSGGDSPFMAYCFAEKKGFSSFGGFKGNGSTNGPFCYTGFRPAYVMIKNTSAAEAWNIWDNKRNTPVGSKNAAYTVLEANSSAAETNGSTGQVIDMLSNGFKVRTTSTEVNASNQDMVYFAFAEFPLVSSNSKIGTAR